MTKLGLLSVTSLSLFAAGAAFAAAQQPAGAAPEADRLVLLASTIGPIDAGIVPLLEERFEQETGIRVRHVGAGTGQALQLAESGTFDLVLVHAKSLEEKFVRDGFGTERIPLMYNDFVVVGPASDPAEVKGARSGPEALARIAAAKSPFVSRGDKSGTHVAELALWEKAGVSPAGAWYDVYEKGSQGNAPTLEYADRKGAYTVIDRATWLSLRKSLALVVLAEKDEALLNFISIIPVNAARFPKVNRQGALRFAAWLTAPEHGQKIIQEFGKEKYGAPLFFPNSREWVAAKR